MSVSDTLTDEQADSFLQYLLKGAMADAERRVHQRHPLSVTLLVQPLNADLQPDGDPFRVMTRDVSSGGFGFVHAEPIKHKFLSVALPDPNHTPLLVEVQHSTAVGELGLLYLTGVRLGKDLARDQRPTNSTGKSVERTTVLHPANVPDSKRQ